MPWFRNHYVCEACDGHWIAEHTEVIEAHCPFCRVYDVAPYKSDDWSLVVQPQDDGYVVLEAAAVTAQGPNYRPLGHFDSRDAARAFVAAR
jgi:hypothetical protein